MRKIPVLSPCYRAWLTWTYDTTPSPTPVSPTPVSPTPSPSPSPLKIADARELALKFKVHLELFGDKSSSAWKLLPMMRDAANSRLFGVLMDFAQRCVELLAAENERWIHENGRQPSWEAIGFKRLSSPATEQTSHQA